MFIDILNLSLLTALMAFVLTQVLFPMVSGSRIFPMFRKKRKELEHKLQDVVFENENEALQRKIEDLQSKTVSGKK